MAPPPPSDPSNQDVRRIQKKSAPFKFLVPLIYAPVLPLIRISLRHRPVLRDRLFIAVLAGAFVHGTYLVFPDTGRRAIELDIWTSVNPKQNKIPKGGVIFCLILVLKLSFGRFDITFHISSTSWHESDIYDAESK